MSMTLKNTYFILGILIIPLLFGLLPIDMINGLFLRDADENTLSLGQVYKLPILIIMVIGLLIKPRLFLIVSGLITILLVPTLLNQSLNFSNYLKDFTNILKWLTPLISFHFFSELFNYHRLSRSLTYWIFFSYIIMVVNILISLFGLGFPMYTNALGANIGTRGFFFAGNEVSVTFLVLYSFIAFKIRKSTFSFPFFAGNIFLAILLSSKTGILGVFLIYLIMRKINNQNRKVDLKVFFKKIFAVIAIIAALFLVGKIIVDATKLGSRLIFFFNKLDFLTFILSGRNLFFLENLNTLNSDYNFLYWITGVGYYEYNSLFQKMVEIDVLDIFFTFGFIGVFLFVFLLFNFLKKTSFKKSISENYLYSYNLCLVLIFISTLTGHTFNSGMAGIFIGFCLAYYKLNGQYEA
jgi:hypothetical protein